MNQRLLMMAAVAVGAVVVLNRAAAQVAPAGSKSAPMPTTSINDQLYTKIMGGAWTSLRDATNPDGSMAFLKRNFLGQTVTSDGKPVSEQWADLFPSTYGREPTIDLAGEAGGLDYLTAMGW